MASITITLTDQAAYRVHVATDADQPVVGRGVTPAESLAIDLLASALKAGATVAYDAQQVPLVALALDILSPEMYGHAVPPELHRRTRTVLGPRMGQLVPQRLLDGVDIDAVHRTRRAAGGAA